MQSWERLGVKFLQLQTRDIFESPDPNKLAKGVQFINNVIRETNGSVYVHCKAGRTRSATLVGCYLMTVRIIGQKLIFFLPVYYFLRKISIYYLQKSRSTPEEAVNIMKNRRPHIWLRKEQLLALQSFYEKNVLNQLQ